MPNTSALNGDVDLERGVNRVMNNIFLLTVEKEMSIKQGRKKKPLA